MRGNNEIFLITSNHIEPGLELGEMIRATTAVATNFKKAYQLAMSLGNINEPSLGYKAALVRCNKYYVVELEDSSRSKKVIIARIKKW